MKKSFLTGLATLIPLAITFWFVSFIVHFLTKPFEQFVHSFLLSRASPMQRIPAQAATWITQACILIALFCFTLFLGMAARRYFFDRLIRFGDLIVSKIPLVNKIYKTSKDIVVALFNTKQQSFQQVVLLPFPYPGAYCLGLITNSTPSACLDQAQKEWVSIFIPTTPNPTTGYLVMRQKSDLIYLQMKPDQAIQYIISCAVVQPKGPS